MLCPNCNKHYTPALTRHRPDLLIQQEFPDAPRWQREQLITGICSNSCWFAFLGTYCPACKGSDLKTEAGFTFTCLTCAHTWAQNES